MKKYLVDTSVFVSHLRGHKPATDFLSREQVVCISYVTFGELLQGVRGKNDLGVIRELMSGFEILWGSDEVNKLAVGILEKHYLRDGMGFLDALQASLAIVHNMIFVTDNLKHFRNVQNLALRSFRDLAAQSPKDI